MVATTPTTPPEIELVRAFVNTVDHEDGTDVLCTPAELTSWLREHASLEPTAAADAATLALARRLRDALRADLESHHTGADAEDVEEELDAICGALPLRYVTGPEVIAPHGGGAAAVLATVLAASTRSRILGFWPRLKICPAEDCRWAFYDTSRNRSRRWCSMEVCGNRSKVRAFRDRTEG